MSAVIDMLGEHGHDLSVIMSHPAARLARRVVSGEPVELLLLEALPASVREVTRDAIARHGTIVGALADDAVISALTEAKEASSEEVVAEAQQGVADWIWSQPGVCPHCRKGALVGVFAGINTSKLRMYGPGAEPTE